MRVMLAGLLVAAALGCAKPPPAPEKETPVSTIPEGWTDDMKVPLPPGRTAADVADYVIDAALSGKRDDEVEGGLASSFGLSAEQAALARDRAFGGVVRAATRNSSNCPSREKDPVAWESFQRATRDPSVVARLYPRYAPQP
jgi:hypothetical protein